MVELRIEFVGSEDSEIADSLSAAGIDFTRSRKSALTGLEVATLTISIVAIVVPTVTQILLDRLRKPDPKIIIYVDGRQQTIISAEQLTLLLEGAGPPQSCG